MIGLLTGCGDSNSSTSQLDAQRQAELEAAKLDDSKQKDIWDAEHITFELEWRFGPPFKTAMKKRDPERIQQAFRDGFNGSAQLVEEKRQVETSSQVTKVVSVPTADDQQQHTAEAFASLLLKPTENWDKVKSVGLRVLKIKQLDTPSRWNTRLLITQDGLKDGQRIRDASEHLVDWTIEKDEDLEDQPVIDSWAVEHQETLSGQDREFFGEVTQQAGLDRVDIPDNWTCHTMDAQQYRFGVAVEDFNRDGYLDLAVSVFGGKVQLLQGNQDLKFQDVSQKYGLPTEEQRNFLATWIDVDNDGYPDLLLGDQFYRNVNGTRLVNATSDSGLKIHPECMGATVADYDCDGRLDLYVLYQRDWENPDASQAEKWVDESETGRENELWRNVGGKFVNVTAQANAGGGRKHTHAAAWFFYDQDRYPDLYISNDFGRNTLLRNRGDGTFEDISEGSGTSGFSTSMGVATGDLNNDGDNEIYVSNMYSKMGRRIIAHVDASDYPDGMYEQILGSCAGNQLYSRSDPDHAFEELGEELGVSHVGWAFGPAFSDFNNDGLLDIYSTTGFMSFKRGKPDG